MRVLLVQSMIRTGVHLDRPRRANVCGEWYASTRDASSRFQSGSRARFPRVGAPECEAERETPSVAVNGASQKVQTFVCACWIAPHCVQVLITGPFCAADGSTPDALGGTRKV